MARYTGPRVRVSRRIGFNVFENRKGDKALQDRPYPPGENGRKRKRETDYGDVIEIKDASKDMIIIQHTIDTGQDYVTPSWLDVDSKKKAVKIAAAPTRNDASSQIEEQLIVELYSK